MSDVRVPNDGPIPGHMALPDREAAMAPIDVPVPREATDEDMIYALDMTLRAFDPPAKLRLSDMRKVIATLEPFLRAQWEADLLSDEAADRFFDRWTLDSKLNPKRAYRESIQAALGSPPAKEASHHER